MKKIINILMAGLITISLVGCSSAPSEEKIKTAIDEGTITIEDAKSKGWIDDDWVEGNFEQIDAQTKVHSFTPFETTYLDGTPVSSEVIFGKMCLVFFNSEENTTMETLNIYNDVSEEMEDYGVPILGVSTNKLTETDIEKLSDMKFPIIIYNDEMKKSLEMYDDLINNPVTSVFTKDGGFYSAWTMKADKEKLLSFARSLSNED